jgi:hypothetical protein
VPGAADALAAVSTLQPSFRTTTMRKNNRSAARSKQGTKAWIRFDNGFSVRPCLVVDLSNAGVRLIVEHPSAVADQFSLLLKRNAAPGRRCRIKWRRDSEIGAEFIG